MTMREGGAEGTFGPQPLPSGVPRLNYITNYLLERPPVMQKLRTSQHFMKPQGSVPCSQETSTGPFPEPDQSSVHHLIPSLKDTC
jgi:hypothetical protein